MYRVVTLAALRQNLSPLSLDDASKITSQEITKNISGIASNPDVRQVLVEKQRALANGIYDYEGENSSFKLDTLRKSPKGIVMDGRDVGTSSTSKC
ncbi:unnamed protein product [Rhizophagus irregularis]|nr:unnamed protein product [Rhizophagus irregularis]